METKKRKKSAVLFDKISHLQRVWQEGKARGEEIKKEVLALQSIDRTHQPRPKHSRPSSSYFPRNKSAYVSSPTKTIDPARQSARGSLTNTSKVEPASTLQNPSQV